MGFFKFYFGSALLRAQTSFQAGVMLSVLWGLFFINQLLFPGKQSEHAVLIMGISAKLAFAFSVFEYFEFLLFRKPVITYQYQLVLHDHTRAEQVSRGGVILTEGYIEQDEYREFLAGTIVDVNKDHDTDFDMRHVSDFRLIIISKEWK